MIRRLALIALLPWALLAPALASAQTPKPLTHTPPSWLKPAVTTTTAAVTATVPVTTTAAPTATTVTSAPKTPSGNLPFTGDDLLPEAIAAAVLIGAGVLIRVRW